MKQGGLWMTRIKRSAVLIAVAALCLGGINCGDSEVDALSVDNANTAASLGVSVGTTIPLSCLSNSPGGTSEGHILLGCSCGHLHGELSVPVLGATAGDTDAFVCGHGCVIQTSSPDIACD